MSRRLWWSSGFVLLLACSGAPCDSAANVFVELAAGTGSLSSFSATGACAPGLGGCLPLNANCDTSECGCRLEVQINRMTLAAGQTELCHLRVVSATGAVFEKDLSFTSNASACISGPSGIVKVDFSTGTIPDAGSKISDAATSDTAMSDASASDASTSEASASDASASDASASDAKD